MPIPPPRPSERTLGKRSLALSLPESIFIGVRNNRSIRSASIDRVVQKFSLRVSEDRFTPKITLNTTAQQQRSTDQATNIVDVSPAVTWLTPTGAVIGFTWANTAISDTTGFRSRSSTANLSLVQPLLRGAGQEVNLAPVRSARLGEEINRLRLRSTVSETVTTIILAHRELLRLQEQHKLALASVERARDLIKVSQALIDAGKMAAVEIVQVEADAAARDLAVLEIESQIDAARLRLLTLLAVDLSSPVRATEQLDAKQVRVQLNDVLPVAYRRRSDYHGLLLIVEQQKLGIFVAQNERLWDLSVFANAQAGPQETLFPGVPADRRPIRNLTFGVQLSAPLSDLSRELPAVQAQTSLQNADLQLAAIKQGIEGQVRGAVRDIDVRWRQLELSRKASGLAAQALDIEKQKLQTGRSTNFQVLSFETRLRESETQQLTATIAYLNALSLLDLQLGTTLDTWRISLND